MTDTPDEIIALFKTFKNPRYTTEENPATAPITLDGVFNGREMQFIATPQDVMEYGRVLWHDVHNGKYGPIGDFNPSVDELRQQVKEQCSFSSGAVSMEASLNDQVRLATLQLAATAIVRNHGKIPVGDSTGERLQQIANIWGVALEHLPNFIKSVEEFRLGIVTMMAQLSVSADAAKDKKSLLEVVSVFEKEQ
jgi:hypothetical protein